MPTSMTKNLMKIDIAITHQMFIGKKNGYDCEACACMFRKITILGDNSYNIIPINDNFEE